ncbi:helix-turn-helix domain-containing protein [Microscilla marina]|uniref:Helix-turn-helix domain protein n=1 Tax=Microscilla marina ATCC 23134 TaxID=313606 RepID=A1ZLM6_MICM2|nr:helix-turn-helix transcriptional regulator [Microscilla marina]EAY28780.1 helix-turn-helix domain protein [Microscilla marina ATCC 23134]
MLEEVAKRITSARKSLGLGQKELERELNLSKGTITKIENLTRKIDSHTLIALYDRFYVSPNYILLGLGEMILEQGSSNQGCENVKSKTLAHLSAYIERLLEDISTIKEERDGYKKALAKIYDNTEKGDSSVSSEGKSGIA